MAKDQKQIETELLQAQNKLSDIMTAINRERLSFEEWQGKIKDGKESAEVIERKIEQLKSNLSDLQVKWDESQKKQAEELADFCAKKSQAISELEAARASNKAKIEELNSKKAEAEEAFKTTMATLALEESELKNDIGSLREKIATAEKILKGLGDKIDKATIQDEKLEIEIQENEKELANLKIGVEMKTNELDSLKEEIDNESEHLSKLTIETNAAQINFDEWTKKSGEVKEKLDSMQQEITDFIKAKFDFQQAKQDLLDKEEFIKEKYTAAGVKWG